MIKAWLDKDGLGAPWAKYKNARLKTLRAEVRILTATVCVHSMETEFTLNVLDRNVTMTDVYTICDIPALYMYGAHRCHVN